MTEGIVVRRVAVRMLQVVRRGICCKGKAVVVEGMVAFVMSLPCPDLCRKLH